MRFGVIGLGRMGASMARHAVEKGHSVIGFDESAEVRAEMAATHIQCARSIEELVATLASPRVIILSVPHGEPTHTCCNLLCPLLSPGDLVCDNGNSHWEDSKRHAASFAVAGIGFLDIGTSGGVSGARHGGCFMVGGERRHFERVEPILRDLAVDDDAVYYVGPTGSGHFVKLIHNAIEFGMIQSIAEGIEMLMRSEYDLDLPSLLNNWMHGSVVRSWLVELMGKALSENRDFGELCAYVEDTGEVKRVLDWALKEDIPTPVISLSQTVLMQYRDIDTPMAKAVALLRNQFGGHPVHKAGE
jgi:6-phosphogluconate dehydrogenase